MVSQEEASPGQLPIDFGPVRAARILPFLRPAHPAPPTGRDPEDAAGWCALGAELEPSDPPGALDAYRKALELAPDHPEAHVNLGRLFHETGHVGAAEMHYRRALRADPTTPPRFSTWAWPSRTWAHRARR